MGAHNLNLFLFCAGRHYLPRTLLISLADGSLKQRLLDVLVVCGRVWSGYCKGLGPHLLQ